MKANYTVSFYTPGVLGSDTFYGLIPNVFIPLYRKPQKGKKNLRKESAIRHQEATKVAEL
jgi:hypothetical protein